MDIATYRKITGAKGYGKPSKFRNKKTLQDGVLFDSKGEANRWVELQLIQKSGQIRNLERQVRIPCLINGKKVFTYVADFMYHDTVTRENVIEDFKGMETDVFKLKKKILEAQGVHIKIVKTQSKKK